MEPCSYDPRTYKGFGSTRPDFLSHIGHSIATTDMVLTRTGRVPHSVSLTWGRALGAGRGRKAPRSLPGDILTRPGSICQKWTPGHIGNKCAMNLATSEKQQCFEVLLASNDPVSGRTV